MNEQVTSKKQKIIYYTILAVMLLLIGAVTVIAIVQGKDGNVSLDDPVSSDDINEGNNPVSPNNPSSSSGGDETPGDPTPENPTDKPVAEVISFVTPVQGGSIIKEYTDNFVVYSSTLGVYTGHMGIDFGGSEGAKVVCAYKGTVKEITTGYLQGTTVKIEHKDGLITVYNSIEPLEGLSVGDSLEQGDVIGTISDNNKQEYKDGAHLHFEVIENGVNVSPLKYLTIEEK